MYHFVWSVFAVRYRYFGIAESGKVGADFYCDWAGITIRRSHRTIIRSVLYGVFKLAVSGKAVFTETYSTV